MPAGCFVADRFKELDKYLSRRGHALVALPSDPVDEVWGSARPPLPLAPVVPLDLKFTGMGSAPARNAPRPTHQRVLLYKVSTAMQGLKHLRSWPS